MDEEHQPSPSQSLSGQYNAQVYGSGTATVNVYEHIVPRVVDARTLDAATHLLATLPLDRLPIAGPLSPASRLPAFARNPSFVGREGELAHIAQILKAHELATVAITGLGGVGKSQLASEFVYRYGQYFAGGVFWLSFSNADAVPAEVAVCTIALGQELRLDARTLPTDEQVHLVLSSWQNPLPRLLVFDNCEEERLLARWRPRIGGCCMLITSRRGIWHPDLGVSLVPLDVLPRAKSVELLGTYRSDLSARDRELIAQELGDLPLALSLAGSYLHTYQESRLGAPQHYLRALRQVSPLEHSSLQQEGSTYTTGHIEHVARTFALSYEQLHPEEMIDATALHLLAHVACFAPGEPIPRNLLRMTMGPEEDEEDEDRFVKALKRVHALGLLNTQQEGAQQMHRLLVMFIQVRIASTETERESQTAVERVVRDFAWEVNDTGYPSPLLRVQEHLRAVTARASEREDARAMDLNATLGVHLRMIGAYQEAQGYLERALTISEQQFGPEHPDTANSLNNLAALYQNQGRYEQAEPLYKRALAIREQQLGAEHPSTANSLNNLATLYQNQGRYAQAESLLERALIISEQQLGAEHPDTADSLLNLANLYQNQGKYEQAEPLYERALVIREQQFGPEHPDTAASLNNLATLYQNQGRYEQAEPLLVRALAISEQQLGPEHPDMAQSLNNLATLYDTQGKYEQAEALYERALAIREQQLGPEHPDMAQSLNNLALLYLAQGRYEQAEPLLVRALAISEQQLRPEHPDTAASLNSLAGLYWDQGRYEQAEPLLVRALAISEQQLGAEHPSTATTLHNLALLYRNQGRYEQAEALYERALAIRERLLGPEHPDTAQSFYNLASLYQDQGKYEQAKPLYERVLAISEQQLGPEHPDTAAILYDLASLYRDQGRYEQAEPLLVRALAISEQQLGPEHSDTAASLHNLANLYLAQGRYEQAEPLLLRALAISEQQLGPEHPDTANSLNSLAGLYWAQGRYEQAELLYKRALAIREQQLGPEHPDTQTVRENYAVLLRTMEHKKKRGG